MKVTHNSACTRVWGRLSAPGVCPRCEELRHGAPARAGWGGTSRARRMAAEARLIAEIRAHNCVASRCASVCTFGDW